MKKTFLLGFVCVLAVAAPSIAGGIDHVGPGAAVPETKSDHARGGHVIGNSRHKRGGWVIGSGRHKREQNVVAGGEGANPGPGPAKRRNHSTARTTKTHANKPGN